MRQSRKVEILDEFVDRFAESDDPATDGPTHPAGKQHVVERAAR